VTHCVTIPRAAVFTAWLARQGVDTRELNGPQLRMFYELYQRRSLEAQRERYARDWGADAASASPGKR